MKGILRGHWPFLIVLVSGLVLRVLTMAAYYPAFWFQGDSGAYLKASGHLAPGNGPNTLGYPLFLAIFRPFGSLALVSAVQHLLGLALAVLIYVFLRRRGLPGWMAVLGATPTLLDGHQITLEHYLLGEALFTVLLTASVIVLLWNERPTWLTCAGAGALLTAAVLTRTVGLGICALVLVYLVIRRAGLKQVLAFGLTVLVLMLGYLTWSKATNGHFALSTVQGRYLYARTAIVADCSKLELTDEQRPLCPREPLDQRPERPDWYLWVSPVLKDHGPERDDIPGGFAKAVITQQPLDYAGSVLSDLGKYLLPGQQHYGPSMNCLSSWWLIPSDLRDTVAKEDRCKPLLADGSSFASEPSASQVEPSVLRDFLAWYSRHVQTPHTALGIAVLLGLAALAFRVRRGRWRDGLDAGLLVGTGPALMVVAVATSMYEPRYGVPSITLIAVGAMLAVHRLRGASAPAGSPPELEKV